MFEKLTKKGFQVLALHHAEAVLTHDMGEAANELEKAFLGFRTTAEELGRGGGGAGQMTQRLRRLLADDLGWHKHTFEIKKSVDGVDKESTSHIIDHVKTFAGGTIALEMSGIIRTHFLIAVLEWL